MERLEYWRTEFVDYTVDIRIEPDVTLARVNNGEWVECKLAQIRSNMSSKKALEKILYED